MKKKLLVLMSLMTIVLTACSFGQSETQEACDKWQEALQIVVKDEILHTTEKVVMLYDGVVGSNLEMEKYYSNGVIYYYCLQNENTETYVVSKDDRYYLKTVSGGVDTPWRELEKENIAAYSPYGKASDSFEFQVDKSNVQCEETEDGVVITYENKDIVGEYMGDYPYESQMEYVYFDKEWNLKKIEIVSKSTETDANGATYKIEIQNTVEFHDTDDETIRQKIMEGSQMFEMSKNGGQVEDEAILSNIENLLMEENKFYSKLSCEWTEAIDDTKQYEINDSVYYLVIEDGVTSWEYYENIARTFYAESYIQEKFTPHYVPHVYVEQEGRLYRAMADGIGDSLVADSIEVYERADGLYYVAILTETDMEGSKNSYILEKALDAPYGFIIVAKTSLL